MMPAGSEPAYNPTGLGLPPGKGTLPPPGQMFTLALLKAGRGKCASDPCESCVLLRRIVDSMEKALSDGTDS